MKTTSLWTAFLILAWHLSCAGEGTFTNEAKVQKQTKVQEQDQLPEHDPTHEHVQDHEAPPPPPPAPPGETAVELPPAPAESPAGAEPSETIGEDFTGEEEVMEDSKEPKTEEPKTKEPDNIAEVDLAGGHFDVDISTKFYELNKKGTDAHVHEFDDALNVGYVDAMDLADTKLKTITETISRDEKFVLVVGNATLSEGAWIDINDKLIHAKSLDGVAEDKLTVYSLSGVDGTTKLSSLKIKFEKDVLTNDKFIKTETSCVRGNKPGPNGEYRNGALLVQALKADQIALDAKTKIASKDSGFLWEVAVFHHWKGGCYE